VTAGKPANHIPTSAPCIQCHTAGNYAQYSSPATHQGVTECLSCHAPAVVAKFSTTNPAFSILSIPGNHIPPTSPPPDCGSSGCHTTANVTPGGAGFRIGTPSISSPTLNVAGHTAVSSIACATCHESAPYMGMMASTSSAMGDSRPPTNATYDTTPHPTTGDCGNCHVTTPTFASNLLPTAGKPSNHIPTTA